MLSSRLLLDEEKNISSITGNPPIIPTTYYPSFLLLLFYSTYPYPFVVLSIPLQSYCTFEKFECLVQVPDSLIWPFVCIGRKRCFGLCLVCFWTHLPTFICTYKRTSYIFHDLRSLFSFFMYIDRAVLCCGLVLKGDEKKTGWLLVHPFSSSLVSLGSPFGFGGMKPFRARSSGGHFCICCCLHY